MRYKTMVLELLQQCPVTYDRLRIHRTLLPTLEDMARELKDRHETWKEFLAQAKPGRDASQIASEALEIALKELTDRLPSEFPPDESEPPSLDGAMAFTRRHTPPA
jgi:hypothetical protein